MKERGKRGKGKRGTEVKETEGRIKSENELSIQCQNYTEERRTQNANTKIL